MYFAVLADVFLGVPYGEDACGIDVHAGVPTLDAGLVSGARGQDVSDCVSGIEFPCRTLKQTSGRWSTSLEILQVLESSLTSFSVVFELYFEHTLRAGSTDR